MERGIRRFLIVHNCENLPVIVWLSVDEHISPEEEILIRIAWRHSAGHHVRDVGFRPGNPVVLERRAVRANMQVLAPSCVMDVRESDNDIAPMDIDVVGKLRRIREAVSVKFGELDKSVSAGPLYAVVVELEETIADCYIPR